MYATATDNMVYVIPEEQIKLPTDIRSALGSSSDGKFIIIAENGAVQIMNPALYALKQLQKNMAGAAEATGLDSDEAIAEWVTEERRQRRESGLW